MRQGGAAHASTENDGGASHAIDDPLRCGYTLTPDDIERDEDDNTDRFDEIFHVDDRDDSTVVGRAHAGSQEAVRFMRCITDDRGM